MDLSAEKTSGNSASDNNPPPESMNENKYKDSDRYLTDSVHTDFLNIPAQFLDSLPFPMFVKDLEGTYLACNQHFCDLIGFTSGQIIGEKVNCLFNPESSEIHISADRQLIESGLRVVYETTISSPEIEYGLIRVIKSPIRDNDGNLSGIIGLISEITSGDNLHDSPRTLNTDIDEFFNLVSSRSEDEDNRQTGIKTMETYSGNEKLKFENRLDIVLKALNAGIWEWIVHIDRLLFSDRCYEILGLKKGLDKPEEWKSRIHPDDRVRILEMWSGIAENPGWFELEFRVMVEGQARWIKLSGYCIKGNGSNPVKVTGVMADISEEKDFSEKLFNSQRLFKAIVEDQSEQICRIRPDGTITFINRAFARFFNVPAEDMLRQLITSVFPEKDFTKIMKLLNCIKPTRQFVNYEQRINDDIAGDSVIHWTIRAIYNQDEIPEEYQFVGRDVTDIEASREALKRSEEMFRLIAENSTDIISIHPKDGTIEYVSPSVRNILGFDPEELIGTYGEKLLCFEDIRTIIECRKTLRKSDDPILITFRLKDKSGNLIWFESMLQQHFNNNGEVTGKIIAVSRNIQRRKLAEEQQLLTEQQLKEANLTKDKFFSIIAHDLRSPFSSILGFTRLLNDEYDDFSNEERKMMVKQILNSTESTFQLLDNLLAWAKSQLGRTIYNPEHFSLESLIIETVKQTAPLAQIKKITITARDVDEADVFADLNMIRTVLRNLLTNAIKFSFPGSIIELGSQTSETSLTISVTDHGTGIEPELLKNLFSLNEKTITTKGTANEKGTGLGLILCKEFIERNGGTISAVSEFGKGSTFSINMPLKSGK